MASAAARIANIVLAVLLCPRCEWGWGYDGNRIVAVTAADNLTSGAKRHAASILGELAYLGEIAMAIEAVFYLFGFRVPRRRSVYGSLALY